MGAQEVVGAAAAVGLDEEVGACLFDLDGVLTRDLETGTPEAWKQTFDTFLTTYDVRTQRHDQPFDEHYDYETYLDGRASGDGIGAFLGSRGIEVPDGDAEDMPGTESVHGIGVAKQWAFLSLLDEHGPRVHESSVRYARAVHDAGLPSAVVTSSGNADAVLAAAGIAGLFDATVDGRVAAALGLLGKPAPDDYLAAARGLHVEPGHSARLRGLTRWRVRRAGGRFRHDRRREPARPREPRTAAGPRRDAGRRRSRGTAHPSRPGVIARPGVKGVARGMSTSAAKGDPLAEYRRRRDPSRSPEPAAGHDVDGGGERPVFVVQLHDARRMHFDLRLEADGVLKSFAVPRGPSSDPQTKRLATPTEDHPLDYRGFEGVIPKGEYGGGTMMIWDEGTYRNLSKDHGHEVPLSEALERGHASFWLDGAKLHGGYALTRMRPDEDGRAYWLLVKKTDRHAGADHEPDPRRVRSARTGRTLRQIAEDRSLRDEHPA